MKLPGRNSSWSSVQIDWAKAVANMPVNTREMLANYHPPWTCWAPRGHTDVVPIHRAYNQATKPSSSGKKTNWGSGKLSRGFSGLEISREWFSIPDPQPPCSLPPELINLQIPAAGPPLRSLLPLYERKAPFLPTQTISVLLDSRYENP